MKSFVSRQGHVRCSKRVWRKRRTHRRSDFGGRIDVRRKTAEKPFDRTDASRQGRRENDRGNGLRWSVWSEGMEGGEPREKFLRALFFRRGSGCRDDGHGRWLHGVEGRRRGSANGSNRIESRPALQRP